MKKRFFGMLTALAALLATVALAGCSNGSTTKPEPLQSGAVLEWVKIGTVEASYPNESDADPAGVLAAGYDAADIPLTNSQKGGDISYALAATSNKAKVEVAQVAAANQASPSPEFSATLAGRTFNDGDWLVVKVTSEDGSKTLYYRFNITLGRNAFLASVTIGSTPQNTEQYLGVPGAAFAEVTVGEFQTDQILPTSKFIALAQDEEAVVSYAFEDGVPSALPGSFTPYAGEVPLSGTALTDGVTHLYIKVAPTSSQGITLYYIMKLILPKAGTIKYGVPKLVDPTDPGAPFYIDPIWDTAEEFDIDRANQAENTPAYFKTDPHTSAKAKAMWDDNGIWVLVDVSVKAASQVDSRPIVPTADHTGDSLEVFVNERLQRLGSTDSPDWGNQYRLGVGGARTGETGNAANDEGEPRTGLAPFDGANYAKFRTALKKTGYASEITSATPVDSYTTGTLVGATNGGYLMIAYVPFKFKESDNADAVFENGSVKDGAKIGFELQVNCNSGSGRDGILTWNGVNSIAYQNAVGYGVVTLDRASKPVDSTVFPEITAQALSNGQYPANETSVTDLSVTTNGSVQWFKATTPYGAGTAIPSATSATFTPPTDVEETNYYYAVVTTGGVSLVTNRRASISVGEAEVDDEYLDPSAFYRIWLKNNGYALFKFNLPEGMTWSDFEGGTLTAEYRVDDTNFAESSIRSRLMGVYTKDDLEAFANTTTDAGLGKYGSLSGYNGPWIMINQDGFANAGITAADTWQTGTYSLTPTYGDHTKLPAGTAKGPFWFGIGPTGNGGTVEVTFDVRKVTLVSSNGLIRVESMGAGSEYPGGAHVGWDAAEFTREILFEDTNPVIRAAEGKTLFSAVGSYNAGTEGTTTAATTYEYEGNEYWIVADARPGENGYVPWADVDDPPDTFDNATRTAIQELQQSYGTTAGYTRIAYDLEAGFGQDWAATKNVIVTYDLVSIFGGTGFAVRNAKDAGSQDAANTKYDSFTEGTNKTLVCSATTFFSSGAGFTNGGISIVKNGNTGAFLLRITKIELTN